MNVTLASSAFTLGEGRRVGAGEGKPKPIGAGAPAAQQQQAQAPAQQQQAPAQPAGSKTPVTPLEPEKEWTVLMYMNGNNGLSTSVVSNLRQLDYVGSDKNINWVAQASRAPGLFDKWKGDWTGTRRYAAVHNGEKLTPDVIISTALLGFMPGSSTKITSPVVQDLGDKNMGKAQTLKEFLEWGMAAYPAKHYMVVMQGPSAGLSGMMNDEIHGSKMKIGEVGQVFADVHASTGKKVDVVAIDGSTTTSMELAWELKDNVNYMIGSQGIQAGGGMFIGQIANEIKNLNQDHVQDAATMSRMWCLMNSMGSGQANISSTISAIDLSKMDGVKQSWDTLAQSLLTAGVSGDKINKLLDDTQDFQGRSRNAAYQNERDAFDFARRVKEDPDITDANVKAAAQAAMDSIEGATIGDAAVGKYVKNAHGISVFAPTHYGYFRPDGTPTANRSIKDADYSNTRFAQDTVWDDVLSTGAKDSNFNNAMKKLGFSENALDKWSEISGKHGSKLALVGNIASMAGWFNAINAWRGAEQASGFLGIPAAYTPYVGMVGAAYDAVNAANNIHYSVTELQDTDAAVSAAFDVGTAGLKAVANLSYINPSLHGVGATAGMLTFFSPWIKNVYGVYTNYKEIKDNIELSNAPSSTKWATAAYGYWANNHLQDKA